MKRIKRRKTNKYKRRPNELIHTRQINLSELDRITYSYKKIGDEYTEVVNSSYETKINKKWITLIRFDTAHGQLHRHTRFSLDKDKEYITEEHVLEHGGGHHAWLTWTLRDLLSNFEHYKKKFMEQNQIDM